MYIKELEKRTNNNDKYMFSFLMITYNQEKYVSEALYSLINQNFNEDYEIIICDDHSIDNTFNICSDIVNKYKEGDGHIKIVLHQNDQNKGIGANFQQAYELSSGTWLLMAAGDDISLPTRLKTVKDIIKNYPNTYGINTAKYLVNENGENPRYNFVKGNLLGADSVWHRDCFKKFLPLDSTVMSEDHILNLRAMLLGEMVQVNIPTIKYRIGFSNYSITKTNNILEAKKSALKKMKYTYDLLLFRLKDLEFWSKSNYNSLLPQIVEKINTEINETIIKIESYKLYIHICESGFHRKLKYIFHSSDKWLHTNISYRIYNVLKMYGFFKYKHLRKKSSKIDLNSNDKVIILTLRNFLDDYIF